MSWDELRFKGNITSGNCQNIKYYIDAYLLVAHKSCSITSLNISKDSRSSFLASFKTNGLISLVTMDASHAYRIRVCLSETCFACLHALNHPAGCIVCIVQGMKLPRWKCCSSVHLPRHTRPDHTKSSTILCGRLWAQLPCQNMVRLFVAFTRARTSGWRRSLILNLRQCCVHGKFLWNFSLPPKIKAPMEGNLLVESPSEARVKGSSSSRKKNTNGWNCLLHELSVTLHVKWPIHGICDACMAKGHGFIENSRKNALTNALSMHIESHSINMDPCCVIPSGPSCSSQFFLFADGLKPLIPRWGWFKTWRSMLRPVSGISHDTFSLICSRYHRNP